MPEIDVVVQLRCRFLHHLHGLYAIILQFLTALESIFDLYLEL